MQETHHVLSALAYVPLEQLLHLVCVSRKETLPGLHLVHSCERLVFSKYSPKLELFMSRSPRLTYSPGEQSADIFSATASPMKVKGWAPNPVAVINATEVLLKLSKMTSTMQNDPRRDAEMLLVREETCSGPLAATLAFDFEEIRTMLVLPWTTCGML